MKQVVLARRPEGDVRPDDFDVVEVPTPSAGAGQVLLKTLYLSLDPMVRFTLDETPLTGPNRSMIGEPVYGAAVSEVVQSNLPDYRVGDRVEARTGWREYAALDPASLPMGVRKLGPDLPPSAALGIVGMPGQTAHACIIEVGRVAAGETVAISAAAGAVGVFAGQIARLKGARAVGIAGGPQKCRRLLEVGFDAAVDYRSESFAEDLAKAAPERINCYVDNVGGDVTLAVMGQMAYRSRLALCGYIAYHGFGMLGPGPDRLPGFMRLITSRLMELRGFGGAMEAGPQALVELEDWLKRGLVKNVETVVEGLDAAPRAFAEKFGRNDHVGKVVVHVADA